MEHPTVIPNVPATMFLTGLMPMITLAAGTLEIQLIVVSSLETVTRMLDSLPTLRAVHANCWCHLELLPLLPFFLLPLEPSLRS
jgi:hypothetical protein